jgi:hypothetical protein
MGWIERTLYPHFGSEPIGSAMLDLFAPTELEMDFIQALTDRPAYLLSAMLLLKSFQLLHHFPRIDQVPAAVVHHVRCLMGFHPRIEPGYRQPVTPSRHRTAIRSFLGVNPCDEAGRTAALSAMRSLEPTAGIDDMINAGVRTVLAQRLELPAFSTMVRLARMVQAERNQRIRALGLERSEVVELLSPGRSTQAVEMRDIASHALARIESQLDQLERCRERLRGLIESAPGSPSRDGIISALCSADEGAAATRARRSRRK